MSLKMIVTCDYCKSEITGKIGYISAMYRKGNAHDGDLEGDNPFEENHFCENCMRGIIKSIQIGNRKLTPEDVKEYKAELEEKPRKKTGVDHEKLCNLYRDGQSVQNIANELHCNPQTVYNHLYKEGLMKKGEKDDEPEVSDFTA